MNILPFEFEMNQLDFQLIPVSYVKLFTGLLSESDCRTRVGTWSFGTRKNKIFTKRSTSIPLSNF